jgi:cysteine desulfurase / selenocysteine lyase
MQSYKQDFPIFEQNPGLAFLDSAASSQKPAMVIDGVSDFFRTSYANIHRGSYDLSERSEDLYNASKAAYAKLIGARANEIIYTYNATYAFNMLAQTLRYSSILQAGDVVLVDIAEHHANIVPWQMLSQRHGIIVEWIDLISSVNILNASK